MTLCGLGWLGWCYDQLCCPGSPKLLLGLDLGLGCDNNSKVLYAIKVSLLVNGLGGELIFEVHISTFCSNALLSEICFSEFVLKDTMIFLFDIIILFFLPY